MRMWSLILVYTYQTATQHQYKQILLIHTSSTTPSNNTYQKRTDKNIQILQVHINSINNKNRETQNSQQHPRYTPICTNRVGKLGGGLLRYIKQNIHWPRHIHQHQHTQYRTTNGQNQHQQNVHTSQYIVYTKKHEMQHH